MRLIIQKNTNMEGIMLCSLSFQKLICRKEECKAKGAKKTTKRKEYAIKQYSAVLAFTHSAFAIDALELVSNRREPYPESFVNRLSPPTRTRAICLSSGTDASNGGRIGTG
jgi:hypothetical protein